MNLWLGRILISAIFFGLMLFSSRFVEAKNVLTFDDKPLRIAVASNFAPTLTKLLARFNLNQEHFPKPIIIAASSGTLFLQIKHGASFDVFLSADTKRPQLLTTADLAVKDSQQTYAYGALALWSAKKEITTDVLTALKNNQHRLAIANPKIAPYGKAAKQVLEHLQLWDSYKTRLIQGINIIQTFQQTRSQAVNLGIVSNSQLVLNHFKGVLIPSHFHQPIKQQLVILKRSKNIQQAQRFVSLLMSKQAQQFIAESGYAKLNVMKDEGNSSE
ncbi:molybdate ABC transporter substrate-binding protein [Colwellia sp. MB02u-14]|uniref:molybdate ABC transporter substrate-binding protein n=1 Tax=Colwellia sp. MB02u-14 TaxID=2759815 RepID=UPI0015F5EF54|nr:molybdate ABC transporter substrate-binding protein [Colwellia sp. MB02u-14]MBA6304052.1 molybdate ABC transporter substrate-binding protein [Colwellia sp. MB02u-14]